MQKTAYDMRISDWSSDVCSSDLNFTAGSANLLSACRAAEIATVYTSRRFVEQAKLEEVASALAGQVELVYLEDLRRRIGLVAKLRGLLLRPFAGRVPPRACAGSGLDPNARPERRRVGEGCGSQCESRGGPYP